MEIEHNSQRTASEITFFKIVNSFVLLFNYLQVTWFFSELPVLLQVIGSVTLLCGFVSLFMPNSPNNVTKVRLLSGALYSGVLVFAIF